MNVLINRLFSAFSVAATFTKPIKAFGIHKKIGIPAHGKYPSSDAQPLPVNHVIDSAFYEKATKLAKQTPETLKFKKTDGAFSIAKGLDEKVIHQALNTDFIPINIEDTACPSPKLFARHDNPQIIYPHQGTPPETSDLAPFNSTIDNVYYRGLPFRTNAQMEACEEYKAGTVISADKGQYCIDEHANAAAYAERFTLTSCDKLADDLIKSSINNPEIKAYLDAINGEKLDRHYHEPTIIDALNKDSLKTYLLLKYRKPSNELYDRFYKGRKNSPYSHPALMLYVITPKNEILDFDKMRSRFNTKNHRENRNNMFNITNRKALKEIVLPPHAKLLMLNNQIDKNDPNLRRIIAILIPQKGNRENND